MNTEDLVRSIAKDDATDRQPVILAAGIGYSISLLVVGVAFFSILGLRPDFEDNQVLLTVGVKLAVTITLAITGAVAAVRATRPDDHGRIGMLAVTPALAVLAISVACDLTVSGMIDWQQRVIGLHSWRCVFGVAALSIVPLAATLLILRGGAVTRHTTAGTIAGLAASGVGASFYSLNCTDDSPLFMLVWYCGGILIVVALGILGANRFVRW